MAARIIGTGSYLPDNIVTNDKLSTMVETSDEWIRSRTGIKERRISTRENTVDLAIEAGKRALLNANVNPEEIDFILVATMTPEGYLPNTACEVQAGLGAINATCFDISAACSGFVFGYNTVASYMEAGLSKTALLIGTETISRVLDWTDRSTCVLFGDGAGAVVIRKELEGGFITAVTGSDGSKKSALSCYGRQLINPFVKEEKDVDYLKMEGQEVFRFAVTKVPECIHAVLEKSNTRIEEIKYMILHQANERIITSVAKRLGIGIEKLPMNLERYGNTSAASIPILLDEINQEGKLKQGDKIIISGFGGGLTWGATLLTW